MSLDSFRTYQLAVDYYREVACVRCPSHLRDQLLRAASSVALNLAEGSAKPSVKERQRYYRIALGSFRESQAVFDLLGSCEPGLAQLGDRLGAHLYRLTHPRVAA